MINKSIKEFKIWQEDRLTFTELIRQEYSGNNCIISGGFVEGNNKPPVDTVYLKLEKDDVEPTLLLLRPDEIQAIAWISEKQSWLDIDSSNLICVNLADFTSWQEITFVFKSEVFKVSHLSIN
jgi:hypothetical protein